MIENVVIMRLSGEDWKVARKPLQPRMPPAVSERAENCKRYCSDHDLSVVSKGTGIVVAPFVNWIVWSFHGVDNNGLL